MAIDFDAVRNEVKIGCALTGSSAKCDKVHLRCCFGHKARSMKNGHSALKNKPSKDEITCYDDRH